MRKLLLNPTPLFRKLRQLSMLLTLLLVPLGALGQTITVAGSAPDQSGAITGTTGTDITGTVSFDTKTNTLTLNDATITGNIVWTNTGENLTIQMSGKNSVNGNITATATCSLHIEKIANAESATLKYTGNMENFNPVTTLNNAEFTYNSTNYHYYTTAAVYNLWLGGIQVHNIEGELGYKDNIFQNDETPTATFDGTNKITLNGATLTDYIHWGADADLTIEIKGTNSITTTSGGNCIDSEYGSKQLSFSKGSDDCSLQLETGGTTIYNFTIFINPGLYKIEENLSNGTRTTITSTFPSTILSGGSGTAADPFIIETADDLKNFAQYVNNITISSGVSVKLSDDIPESGLDWNLQTVFQPFQPIGDGGDLVFTGTFDGNGKTIKNLSITGDNGANVGIFRSLTTNGKIENLTLDNLTISGGSTSSNDIGGLVGHMFGGTISGCTIKNSSISCLTTAQNPSVGGFVGHLGGGTISNSNIVSCVVKAETSSKGASGACAIGGGIAGTIMSGSVSGCRVKGTTAVYANHDDDGASVYAGALIGNKNGGTFSDNTYEYTVTAKARTTTKSEYTQRGIGNGDDVSTDNGAVMYTKIVSLPTVNSAGTVAGVDGTYYKVDETSLYVAPGQTAKIDATPNTANNFALAWLQAVKTVTADVVICDSTNIANGGRRYTFTMPDAEVTVNVSWDELYNLWIGDTQVTSNNAAHILGENNTTVTFTAADPNLQTSANTLTLNGATLTVPVKVGLASLTIDIQGNNTITVPDGNVIKKPSTTTTGLNLTLKTSTADGKLTLTSTSNETIESGGVFSDGFNINIDKSIGLIQPTNSYNLTNGSAEYHVVRFAPSLGVSIGDGYGGTIVITDDNATDVLGDGKVIFKKNSKTLTLNGATLSGAISTSLSELNIDLVGKNSIISYSDGHVIETPYNDDATVNIKSTAQEKGGLTMTLYYSNDGRMVSDHVNLVTAEPLTILSGSLTGNDGNNNSVIIGEDYKLDVAGTKVTYLNKDNILGDTEISVTFTPSSNTLTLNEATINGSIDYNGSEVLTIALNGTNSVTKTSGTYAIYTNGGNFNFVKGEGATSVSLTAECGDGYHSISFGSINLSSGLYWKPIAKNKKIITDDPDFVLVGGYVINDGETKTGKAGTSGTIAYAVNGSEKTLTFTNYQNTFGDDDYGPVNAIETGVVGLKVVLIGDNSITCDDPNTYAFKGIHDDASIQFVKGGDGCKLAMNMNTTVNPFSFGNGKVTYDHLVYSDGNGMLISEPTPPTMVYNDQEKVVLEKGYTDGNIYYTIEYADGKTTGVTGATYSEPFAMKAPGTVEAWVEANGAKTAEVKGKHFGYDSEKYTIKKDETKAVELLPAIENLDYIDLPDAPYSSDAEGIATLTGGQTPPNAIINAKSVGKAKLTTTLAKTDPDQGTVILNKENKFTIEVNVGVTPSITFTPDMLYATYCNTGDKDLKVPDGLKAYAITGVNGNVVTLSQVEFLPMVNGTTYFPLLLKREDKNTEVGLSLEYDGTASAPTSNYLRYAISNVQTTGVEFVLYKDEFVKATGTILEQKCYLYLSGVSFTRGAYDIGDGTTAIDATLIDNEETNDYWYDLQGRRIQKPSKAGLYIKNGKKVIVNTK